MNRCLTSLLIRKMQLINNDTPSFIYEIGKNFNRNLTLPSENVNRKKSSYTANESINQNKILR